MNRIPTMGDLTNIDLRQLKIFKAVVEQGGIAAAEGYLNISRPAISVAVSDLEERISMILAIRNRSGFELTDEGREVYRSILQLFTSIETFKAQINAMHQHLRGDLHIAITDNLVTHEAMKISDALAKLKAEGSEIHINIRMEPPSEVERLVLDGSVHVGVTPKYRASASLEYRPLYTESSLLYCSVTHPLATGQNMDLGRFDAVKSAHPATPRLKELEALLKTGATASDREGVAFLILTGSYIGFLPTHFARRWVNEGKIKSIRSDTYALTTDYVAVTRKGARPNRIVERFLHWLG